MTSSLQKNLGSATRQLNIAYLMSILVLSMSLGACTTVSSIQTGIKTGATATIETIKTGTVKTLDTISVKTNVLLTQQT